MTVVTDFDRKNTAKSYGVSALLEKLQMHKLSLDRAKKISAIPFGKKFLFSLPWSVLFITFWRHQ